LNKAETYCYVIRKQLENQRARVFLHYSNQHPNPEERIEIKRTGDLNTDLQTLLKLVKDELPKYKRVRLEKEEESFVSPSMTIDKYFICVQ